MDAASGDQGECRISSNSIGQEIDQEGASDRRSSCTGAGNLDSVVGSNIRGLKIRCRVCTENIDRKDSIATLDIVPIDGGQTCGSDATRSKSSIGVVEGVARDGAVGSVPCIIGVGCCDCGGREGTTAPEEGIGHPRVRSRGERTAGRDSPRGQSECVGFTTDRVGSIVTKLDVAVDAEVTIVSDSHIGGVVG